MEIKKALVVDDSKVAHMTLRKLLLERGIEVDWVGSGEECVKYLENKKPDVIFMDVMMPGMDGFETNRTIANRCPHNAAPIIMCSANATEEDKRDARDSGAVGFLSKPYTPNELDAVLQMVSSGQAAIVLSEPSESAIPRPQLKEKELSRPTPKEPTSTLTKQPSAAAEPGLSIADIEQIAERVAWAAAEKVSRDIIQDLVPHVAQETATQVARSVAEDVGRRAAHAAVRAAQEAAKQVASEIARGTAERTARTAAQESARTVAEQAAREVSEGVSQRNVARGLEMNRDELLKEIEAQVKRQTQETLIMATGTAEFKQQVVQMARSGLQPIIEALARDTSERSVQQALAHLTRSNQGNGQVTAALIISIVAILVAAAALVGSILKLF